jgi:hypothetical protein
MEGEAMTLTNQESGSALSRGEIGALVAPLEARTRRYARVLALWFLVSGAAVAALVVGLGAYHDKSLESDTLAMGIMLFGFFGVLAALSARYLVLRDLRWLPELVHDGRTLPGLLASHRVIANGIHQLVVLWKEGDEEVGAHFDVDQLRDAGKDRHVTIVSSGQRQVGVVLNGQLYVAVRNTARFLRWKAQQPLK